MKGNTGKARRQRTQRQILAIVASFCLLIVLLELMGYGKIGKASRSKLRQSYQGSKAKFQDRFSQMKAGRGGRSSNDDLDESQILEMILSAEIHLIDLNSKPNEMMKAPSNSYAGVYGTFCKLDFDLHKRDPSSSKFPSFVGHKIRDTHCPRILFVNYILLLSLLSFYYCDLFACI